MSDAETSFSCRVTVRNPEGLHARPVMRFVDLAGTFQAKITVRNVSNSGSPVDGKSAMEMMLLEAVQGAELQIEAFGADAKVAVSALSELAATVWNDRIGKPDQA